MKYLIVQDWPNTHGNHAGMVHMCNLLEQKYPNEYTVVIKSVPRKFNLGLNPLNNRVRSFYERFVYPGLFVRLCRDVFLKIKDGDEVFLVEYLFPETSQLKLARLLRRRYPYLKIYGLSHLTPDFGEKKYPNYRRMVLDWLEPIDKYLTLGTSLTAYFESLGVPRERISTGFHFVDGDFYTNANKVDNERLKIIAIGAMARNFQLLVEIVKATPMVDWVICKGKKNVGTLFDGCNNVQLLGFMEEAELRHQMSLSDVSLSVMEDTIGSNVITTSLSMGLAQIVSDVGSIRDYCSEKDSIFCKNNVDSFVEAVKVLAQNRARVNDMKKKALARSKDFCIENVHKWLSNL